MISRDTLLFAFKVSFPILLGYLAIGVAFGLIIENAGYPWFLALLMSLLIYAGAGQYAAVALFTAGAAYIEIAVAILLINARHMVYGLPLLNKFKGTMPYKPYLIFGLTDETFGVLTTTKLPENMDKKTVYFLVTAFNQLYWISGSMIGFFAGQIIPFNFKGVEFALTSLFVVLLLEQKKNFKSNIVFIIAFISSIVALMSVGSKNMLITSFFLAFGLLILFKRKIEC